MPEIFQPDFLNRSMVAASRLPLGIPSFSSFTFYRLPSSLQLVFVDLLRIKESLGGDFPASFSPFSEEAAIVSHVTGPASELLYLKEERVIVAIDKGALDLLKVAGFLSFEPKTFPGAAVVVGLFGLAGLFPGLTVHVGHHQDLARAVVLNDDRYEPASFGEIYFQHEITSLNFNELTYTRPGFNEKGAFRSVPVT